VKPICVPCERFMRSKHNGIYFIEGMPVTPDHRVGKGAEGWQPYKIWCGDLWHCPTCGTQSIVGVGNGPITERHKPDFENWLVSAKGFMVKDC